MFGLSFPFSFDPALIVPAVMAIGAVFLALQTGIGLFTEARTQAIVNRRLQFKDR
jgi:tight adherence protein B